ncbi:hypothetical protein JZ751_013266, partial [Albula glossodonta]
MRSVMAASSHNAIRVRLCFDYPPPAVADCRMCWMLVDLNKCRVVADLVSIIKGKFDFSRSTVLNLFIEDCYLPPTESVYVVRDNDSIRVKVESSPQLNGTESSRIPESLPWKAKKRDREPEVANEECRIKKRKKAKSEGQEPDPHPAREEVEEEKKKKRKKKEKNRSDKPVVPVKRPTPANVLTAAKSGQNKTATKPQAAATSVPSRAADKQKAAAAESSSDTSDSSEEEPPKKAAPVSASSRPSVGGASVAKSATRNVPAAAAASSSTDSSSDSPTPKKTLPPPTPAPQASLKTKKATVYLSSSSDSDSSSEDELVIKRPGLGQRAAGTNQSSGSSGPLHSGSVSGRGVENPRGAGRGASPVAGGPGRGVGVGRGDGRFPWRGGGGPKGGARGGHGRARGPTFGNQTFPHHGDQNGLQKQQQHLSDTLTNSSVILQNPPQSTPKRDYTAMPLLAAPPQEGKIIGINQSTNQIELELLSSKPAPAEPGKFDLVYQTPDGSEIVEYAVSRGSQLTEHWNSLLEPRLIVESTVRFSIVHIKRQQQPRLRMDGNVFPDQEQLLQFLKKLKEVFDVCDEDEDGYIRVEHFVDLGLQFGKGDDE